MTRLRLTPQARADLVEIGAYISRDSPKAAERFVGKLLSKAAMLAEHPAAGRKDERRPGRRIFPVGQYVVIYRERTNGADILRFVHGRRDLRLF